MSFDVPRVLELVQQLSRQRRRARDAALVEGALRAAFDAAAISAFVGLDRAARAVHFDDDDLRYGGVVGHCSLIVISMTRSGYTRHDAVRALGGHDPWTLGALLLRLDDVVAVVREEAAMRLTNALQQAPVASLIAVLPLIDVTLLRERGGLSPILQLARERILAVAVDDDDDRPDDVRRALAHLFGLNSALALERRVDIAARAAADGDVDLALAIAKDVDVGRAVADAFAAHRAGRLRLRAVQLLAGQLHSLLPLTVDVRGEVRAAARRTLGDSTDEQREFARDVVDGALSWTLTRGASPPVGDRADEVAVDDAIGGHRGGRSTSSRTLALRACPIPSARAVIGALGSLAEIGRPQDVGRISRFLHDERARVQAEAVRALIGSHASAGLADYRDVLVDKLTHPSWRVAVEAARGLAWLPAEQLPLEELRRREPQVHVNVRKLLTPLVGPGRWSC